jgi:hypothetical protein
MAFLHVSQRYPFSHHESTSTSINLNVPTVVSLPRSLPRFSGKPDVPSRADVAEGAQTDALHVGGQHCVVHGPQDVGGRHPLAKIDRKQVNAPHLTCFIFNQPWL